MKAAHGEETPLVVDPFAGGGSIPLEALRLGCDAFASDLNPVACVILKVMLEDIPRHGPELADQLREAGAEIKKHTEKELARYYPPDHDGAVPIAYLWARTVKCESPNCGAEIPLIKSFWLCKKRHRVRALRCEVKSSDDGKPPSIEFEIFIPNGQKGVREGTIKLGNAICIACGKALTRDRIRAQLKQQHGGGNPIFDDRGLRTGGARLLAVVTTSQTDVGRVYRMPCSFDYDAVRQAYEHLAEINIPLSTNLSVLPDEPIPHGRVWKNNPIRVHLYGMVSWQDLFTGRQKMALASLLRQLRNSGPEHLNRALALVIGRLADGNSSLTRWQIGAEKISNTFSRQALPMVWDFAEANLFSNATRNLSSMFEWVSEYAEKQCNIRSGHVEQADAVSAYLPDDSCTVWFTDPPYYDAVPYADLSDFFYVWLRRALSDGPLTGEPLTPKECEIVVDEIKFFGERPKDRAFFEDRMSLAFAEGQRVLRDDGIGSVVFAHKTTEGWEALLSGMIRGGWTITGSWPVATEMGSRLRARESAALATSVHLVCRPRSRTSEVGDWAEIFRALPLRIGDWMERLSSEGVRGADLVFACIGPAMEIYSRYSRVEDAEGREIPLGGDPEADEPHKRGFLAYVWEIVGRTALEQVLGTAEAMARNGALGALEEDSRLTALFLWTHQSTAANDDADSNRPQEVVPLHESDEGNDEEQTSAPPKKGLTLIYDVVRRFAQPLGIHLETWEDRIIEIKKGIVRLLPVRERADALLGEGGASVAADLIERTGGDRRNYEFAFMQKERPAPPPRARGRGKKSRKATEPDEAPTVAPGMTTLDRVHIATLLQAAGKSNALRTMLKAETERGQDFVRLANALSALYPRDSEEKRLVDAMLLAMPR